MNRTLDGLQNCEIAMDDILIYAKTKQELELTTEKVINKLAAAGFSLNKEKCEFNKTRMKFLGHIFTQNGYEVDDEKVEAIKQLKTPTTVKELQRFLGMVNYCGKFIPNLSELTRSLRELLNKNSAWVWDREQQDAFDKIKQMLMSTKVLKYYDVNKSVKLSVDASSKAMGACLMQDNNTVAYATRAFTKSQQNYPQIEKEAMAIKFACQKFHVYVYGKKLEIETDHKPLETIFKKPLQNAPFRLQRILWDVIQYAPSVKYVKGTQLPVADTLSRDCIPGEIDVEEDCVVNAVLAITDEAQNRLKSAIEKDKELQELKTMVQKGWPIENRKIPEGLKKYSTFKEEITYDNGLLFKAHKVIIPEAEKQGMLKQIHMGHAGIVKSLARARQLLYWHGQTSDIINYVERCTVCQQTQRANPREPMIIKMIPEYPFQIVSTDIFKFKGNDFLLIADHYSGFMDFRKLTSSTSLEVILFLRQWFAVHGIPEILESDGGPQFTARQFLNFVNSWSFKHQLSSPHYPRSNGFAERNVQTAKNLLKQCDLDNTDVYKALLMLRNTPRNEILGSSCQRLFSRTTRSFIPVDREALTPKIVKGVSEELRNLRLVQKKYVDKISNPLKALTVGDNIRMKTGHREWKAAKVVKKTRYPRSVIVQTPEGNKFRRNTLHLHKTKANIPHEWHYDINESNSEANQSTTYQPENIQPDNTTCTSTSNVNNNQQNIDQSNTNTSTTTRSGRVIKPVIRLNL